MRTATASQATQLAAIESVLFGVLLAFAAIVYILTVVAWWRLFTKADEKGWKALIPFYNFYVQCKLTWKPLFFWIIMGLTAITSIVGNFSNVFPPAIIGFTSIFGFAASIALLVFMIISFYRLSKAYGHGGGFTVGLVFLNIIFLLVLAFGKSKYVGNAYMLSRK